MKRFLAAMLSIVLLFSCFQALADDPQTDPDTQEKAISAGADNDDSADGSKNPDDGNDGSAAGGTDNEGDPKTDGSGSAGTRAPWSPSR